MRKSLVLALAIVLGALTTLAGGGIPTAHAVLPPSVTVNPATMKG